MAIRKKFLYIIITILLLTTAAATLLFSPARYFAYADEDTVLALSPVKTEGDGVTYYCFDNPSSVYADGDVKTVAGSSGIYFVYSDENGATKEIKHRAIPADKVYRRTEHENNTEFIIVLYNGKISAYGAADSGAEFAVSGVSGDIIDFDVSDDTLYAITSTQIITAPLLVDGIDQSNATVARLYSDRHSSVKANKLTVVGGKAYISVKAVFGNKWDVCSADTDKAAKADDCALDTVLNQSDEILSLTSSEDNGTIYMLTRSEVLGYTQSIGGGLYKMYGANGSDLTDIFAYGDSVYSIDSLNALYVTDKELKQKQVIAASASDAQGFFNIPSGVAAKNSTLYVADTMNGRVAAYSGNGIRYLDRSFRSPVSVAADNSGALYVAYDDNKVGIFRSSAYSEYDEITVTSTTLGKIRQIAVDSEKTLFILSESGLWKTERDYSLTLLTDAKYKAITMSIGKNNLYALNSDKIVLLDKATGKEQSSRPADKNALSIAVDLNDTAFLLYTDKVESVTNDGTSAEYPLAVDGESYTLGDKSGQILLCFMENSLDTETTEEQNYVIVLDSFRHRILKANCNAIGARLVDYSYQSPDIIGSTAPAQPQTGIIRRAKFNTPLFAYPIETKSEYTIPVDAYVIVPDYTIVAPEYKPEETPEFALVLVDDTVNNRLLQGYVYKDALSEPLPYTAPPSEICTVTGELGTVVYKWPSRNAKAVSGYSETVKNTKFDMLDFVNSYVDGYGYYWYRIRLESGEEGYVPAVNVSTIDYQQANILPEYNAEIVEYNGVKIAKTYTKGSDGKYTEIKDVTLNAGTKIEVVGAYDSSERYTKIKFLDGKTHKTVTCYVETVHVRYSGVNIVLFVALIVIAVTIILAVIIISKTYYSKKKRLNPDEEKKEETETD